ncbi:hypothetical protein G6F43_001702 [Rhizopus delemar]|nr:hypothetical protein G6F43_001702 [Rhizopus delemar]
MNDEFKLPPISTMDRSPFISTSLPTPRLEYWNSFMMDESDNKLDQDIQQVIHQCNMISNNMLQAKDQLQQQSMISSRIWLDDMVNRANEILNALLRLRKHQMAIEQTEECLIENSSRQRKRTKRPPFQGRCHSCNISETPEWRRGPDGARTLCNACGLHYAKLTRKQQQEQLYKKDDNISDNSQT